MKLRKYFLPNNILDWASFSFITLAIPLFYWFELFVVIPDFYESSSPYFWLHRIFGTLIMVNVVGNLLAVMFVDTSSSTVQLPNSPHYCNICKLPVPPRCWHCEICNKCILKRDHHCTFSGCCIGHYNQRYFLVFLGYFFIGCCYALCLNVFYIIPRINFDFSLIFQVFTPIVLLFYDAANAHKYVLTLFLVMNLVGLGISGILLHYHSQLVRKGAVAYEHNRAINKYNYGLRNNIISIFGARWYLTWIWPFIDSKLLIDGVDWSLENVVVKMKNT